MAENPTRLRRYKNPQRSIDFTEDLPTGASVEAIGVASADDAFSHGYLWTPDDRLPSTVVAIMHPRADFCRHYAVPALLRAGFGVWTQNSRWVGNDTTLIHERVLLDVAAGFRYLRERGTERIVALGNSGGGSLYTFYISQAHREPGERLTKTAYGSNFTLGDHDMPRVDAIAYLAAHPGEGLFLTKAVDPSVTDESDRLSCDPSLDAFNPENGFNPPTESSEFAPDFVESYRAAQLARIEHIDEIARNLIAEQLDGRRKATADPGDIYARRQTIATDYICVQRTDADLRCVDLSLDPSERDYGSMWGSRPDLFNYSPMGLGRLTTPQAWLSTWSGISSQAELPLCGPYVDVPAFVVNYTADNGVFPSDADLICDSLGTQAKERLDVAGDHYGFAAPGKTELGRDIALPQICDWIAGL